MARIQHPSFECLTDLAEGRLGDRRRTPTQDHVAQCHQCSADVDWLTSTMTRMRTDDLESVPEHLLGRARRLFSQRRRDAGAQSPGLFERLIAVLGFDSATMAPAFGLRSSGEHALRQLLFVAGPYEVDMRVGEVRGKWAISGQVLGPTDTSSGEVELISPTTSVRASLSELLEFNLPSVESGTYRLELRLAESAEIAVESLELGP